MVHVFILVFMALVEPHVTGHAVQSDQGDHILSRRKYLQVSKIPPRILGYDIVNSIC